MPGILSRRGTVVQASIDINSSGDNTIVSAVAGERVRIYRLVLFPNAAVGLSLKDGASTDMLPAMNLDAKQPFVLDSDNDGNFPYTTTAGNAFIINLDAASQVVGTVWYIQSAN